MREIVTAVEMKELDHNTIQKAGISSPVLMERAALKTVEEIVQRLKNKEKEKILVVCGTGNNGGDGLAIARLLQLRGVRTWYYIAGKEEKMTAETAGQLKTAEYYQVPRVHNLDLDEYTTIVDAIFGVGLSRPVEGKYAELISTMNRASAYKVAVDIPSGIDEYRASDVSNRESGEWISYKRVYFSGTGGISFYYWQLQLDTGCLDAQHGMEYQTYFY